MITKIEYDSCFSCNDKIEDGKLKHFEGNKLIDLCGKCFSIIESNKSELGRIILVGKFLKKQKHIPITQTDLLSENPETIKMHSEVLTSIFINHPDIMKVKTFKSLLRYKLEERGYPLLKKDIHGIFSLFEIYGWVWMVNSNECVIDMDNILK